MLRVVSAWGCNPLCLLCDINNIANRITNLPKRPPLQRGNPPIHVDKREKLYYISCIISTMELIMKNVSASEIKSSIGRYLQIVELEPVFIEETHNPFAVLLSYKEYERLKAIEDAYWADKATQAEHEGYLGESESLKVIQAA